MRKAKIKGKEVVINEKTFNKILSRFNPKNFKLGGVSQNSYAKDRYINQSRCYLCDINNNECYSCPFGVFEKHSLGCFEAIQSILTRYQRKVFWDNIFLFDDEISYYMRNKRSAEKIIKTIYSAINEGFRPVKGKKSHI